MLKLMTKETGQYGILRRYQHPRLGVVEAITSWRFGGTIIVVNHQHGWNHAAAFARGQVPTQKWPTPIDERRSRSRRKPRRKPAARSPMRDLPSRPDAA